MSLRIETVHSPRVTSTTPLELDEAHGYEHDEDEAGTRVLALSYDELVVVSGDLERFARDVWRAVFGDDVPANDS